MPHLFGAMPKVAILIPASCTHSFFSQLAAFNLALRSLSWNRWEPTVLVCMGEPREESAFFEWLPFLQEVAFVLAPDAQAKSIPFYYAQIDGLFRWAPRDADVYLRMDADTLPVGNFEDVLDYVVAANSVAGVMAHIPFPPWPGMTTRQAWLFAAEGLTTVPLDFRQAYSFADSNAPEDDRIAPFYLNDGVVFVPKSCFDAFAGHFLDFRRRLMDRLARPYYAGQVALSLAVTEMRARTLALPMRYNFPNDEIAASKYPEELENVKIFHYLRYSFFDRQAIFSSAMNYERFLDLPLTGVNQVFQDWVLKIVGATFPFPGLSERSESLQPGSADKDATMLPGKK